MINLYYSKDYEFEGRNNCICLFHNNHSHIRKIHNKNKNYEVKEQLSKTTLHVYIVSFDCHFR